MLRKYTEPKIGGGPFYPYWLSIDNFQNSGVKKSDETWERSIRSGEIERRVE